MIHQATPENAPPTTTAPLNPAGLLAQRCGGDVTRLDGTNWKKFLKEMPRLGPVRTLTSNRAIHHERLGPYRWVRFIFNAGQTGGPEVDLRLFMQNWSLGFAVSEEKREGVERRFEFFDKYGDPIHTITLLPESDTRSFDAIVARYRSADQSPQQTFPPRRPATERPDSEIDVEAFRTRWRKMWDTHQFFGLHRKFGLSRHQALRLGPPELVRPLPRSAGRDLFENGARRNVEFMTFSGNRGCLQIHIGKANRFALEEETFRIQESDFHLNIHEPSIAYAYEVKKPTFFGNVTSVELFDEAGENVAVFYGKRGRLEKEHADWRALVETLPGSVR